MITVRNPWIFVDGSIYACGLDQRNFGLLLWGILILFAADLCKYKGVKLREVIVAQDYWAQCLIIIMTVVSILLFGIWGVQYDASGFIYFQF